MMGKPVASDDPQVASLALAIGGFGDRRKTRGWFCFIGFAAPAPILWMTEQEESRHAFEVPPPTAPTAAAR
jgi:hypothetical protein